MKRTRTPKRRVRKVKVKFLCVDCRNWNQNGERQPSWRSSGTAYRYVPGFTATISRAPSLHSTSICLQRTKPRHRDDTQLCYLIKQAGTLHLNRRQLKPPRSTANSCTFVLLRERKKPIAGALTNYLGSELFHIPKPAAVNAIAKHFTPYFVTKNDCSIFLSQNSQHGLLSTADWSMRNNKYGHQSNYWTKWRPLIHYAMYECWNLCFEC